MKLLTKDIINKMPPIYSTDGADFKNVVVKFFCPWNQWTWYVFEGEQREDGDWEFFGLVEGLETELGYFVLSELESIRGPGSLRIERDLHFSGYYENGKIERLPKNEYPLEKREPNLE